MNSVISPDDVTNNMAALCVCCRERKSKCFGLFSKKAGLFEVRENIQNLFRYDVDIKLLHDYVVCDFCVKLLTKVSDIIWKNIHTIVNPGSF
jgi:hypothetical protein